MIEFKRTIKKTVSFKGIGLHSGEISEIICKPAKKNE